MKLKHIFNKQITFFVVLAFITPSLYGQSENLKKIALNEEILFQLLDTAINLPDSLKYVFYFQANKGSVNHRKVENWAKEKGFRYIEIHGQPSDYQYLGQIIGVPFPGIQVFFNVEESKVTILYDITITIDYYIKVYY